MQWVTRVISAVLFAFVSAGLGASPDWLSFADPVSLRIEAPFNELFAHAQQNGYSVRGVLSFADHGAGTRVDDVRVTVRGNTSRRESECSFPKLKLAWPGGDLKLGTHCGDSTDDSVTAKFGRLPNERSPWREAFVYRLLDALEVPTLRARPARVRYVYTDAATGTTGTTSRTEPLTRNAILVEDTSAARRRLGAAREIQEAQFTNAREAFVVEDTATLAFAQALIGNFDWCLRLYKGDVYRCDGRHPLWNLLAFSWPDGRTRPVLHDFDVAGMVSGRHRWFDDIFNERFVPSKSHAAIEVIAQLQHARTLFDRSVLDATRRRFARKQAMAYRLLDAADIDAGGKAVVKSYLDPFFDAMASDAAFYRPVVTADDTLAYADADRTTTICAARGPIKRGTPVGDPIDTRGSLVQVIVLDALWQFAPPVQCPAFRNGPVWIERAAIGTAFP